MRPSRKVLRALCALTLAGGAALLGVGLQAFLALHLTASAAAIATVGALVVLISLLGFCGASREKSGPLMLFFFLDLALVTLLVMSSYAALAFQDALDAWIKHHWDSPVLDYLRAQPCCADYPTTVTFMERNATMLGGIALGCLAVVLLSMYCVVRIVTIPIVMKNLLTVVNVAFMALGVGILAFGAMIHAQDALTAGQQWIAIIFVVVGAILFALSLLGIIGSRAKSRTLLLIYVIGIGACFTALLACTMAAFAFTNEMVKDYRHVLGSRSIACDFALEGCSNCSQIHVQPCLGIVEGANNTWESCSDATDKCKEGWTVLRDPIDQGYDLNDIAECGACPEWTSTEVDTYLKSRLRVLGLCAVVVCFFIVVGFLAAWILRKSLAGYQTDSI